MGWADRILTIVVTATVTSAAWIVAGATILRPPIGIPQQTLAAPSAGDALSAVGSRAVVPPLAGPSQPAAQARRSTGTWLIPVAGVEAGQLVDTYTQSRANGARLHEAIDIAAPRGTQVLAAAGGIVEKLFLSENGGRTVYIRLPDRRTLTYYAHLDAYAANLREGGTVRPGQFLGTVGSTGNAAPDAPHLHFAILRTSPDREWYEDSSPLNPYPLLTGR